MEHHGIQNNDMINLQTTNLNQADQDLMLNFFANARSQQQAPAMTQNQMFNQMFHNAQNQRIRQECERIRSMYAADAHFKRSIEAQDKEIATALASQNPSDLEKIVGKRMKD